MLCCKNWLGELNSSKNVSRIICKYSHFWKKQMNNEFFMNLSRIINRKSADRADTNCPFALSLFTCPSQYCGRVRRFQEVSDFMNSGDWFYLWIQEIAFPYMNLRQIDIDFRYIYKSSYLIQKVSAGNRTRIARVRGERTNHHTMKSCWNCGINLFSI